MGSRGYLTPDNRSRLSLLHKLCSPSVTFSKFCQNIAKTSLLCSYAIFLSRNDPWTGAEFIMPVNKWVIYETYLYTLQLYLCVKTNSSAWAVGYWKCCRPTSWSECYCLLTIVSLFLSLNKQINLDVLNVKDKIKTNGNGCLEGKVWHTYRTNS